MTTTLSKSALKKQAKREAQAAALAEASQTEAFPIPPPAEIEPDGPCVSLLGKRLKVLQKKSVRLFD